MTTKRNANIVSLRRDEKASAIRALSNQIELLRAERSPNEAINALTANEIDKLERVVEKLSS